MQSLSLLQFQNYYRKSRPGQLDLVHSQIDISPLLTTSHHYHHPIPTPLASGLSLSCSSSCYWRHIIIHKPPLQPKPILLREQHSSHIPSLTIHVRKAPNLPPFHPISFTPPLHPTPTPTPTPTGKTYLLRRPPIPLTNYIRINHSSLLRILAPPLL